MNLVSSAPSAPSPSASATHSTATARAAVKPRRAATRGGATAGALAAVRRAAAGLVVMGAAADMSTAWNSFFPRLRRIVDSWRSWFVSSHMDTRRAERCPPSSASSATGAVVVAPRRKGRDACIMGLVDGAPVPARPALPVVNIGFVIGVTGVVNGRSAWRLRYLRTRTNPTPAETTRTRAAATSATCQAVSDTPATSTELASDDDETCSSVTESRDTGAPSAVGAAAEECDASGGDRDV
jgi:hypothetical protein